MSEIKEILEKVKDSFLCEWTGSNTSTCSFLCTTDVVLNEEVDVKKFKRYLINNLPKTTYHRNKEMYTTDCREVVFRLDTDRLKWLEKHIKLNSK